MKNFQEAHPIKLKQIHLVNAPAFLDKAMAIMRPFIKSEILSMVSLLLKLL